MFDKGRNSWTPEELEQIHEWEQEAADRNEIQIGRCRNCGYWFHNEVVTSYCDCCLTYGLKEGRRLGREAAQEAAMRAAGSDGEQIQ